MKKSASASSSLLQVVGQNIKAAREGIGLTQSQLAAGLGVEVETVSRYERGVVAPSFQLLERLGVVLKLPVWQLFADGTDMPGVRETGIPEQLKNLSKRDRDFILAFVQDYAEHHKNN